jgi:hypothetical protein
MAGQLPISTDSHPQLPALAIDEAALAIFAQKLVEQLKELEGRCATPRRHPRMAAAESRRSRRRPK